VRPTVLNDELRGTFARKHPGMPIEKDDTRKAA
jgi:hypothetical protein